MWNADADPTGLGQLLAFERRGRARTAAVVAAEAIQAMALAECRRRTHFESGGNDRRSCRQSNPRLTARNCSRDPATHLCPPRSLQTPDSDSNPRYRPTSANKTPQKAKRETLTKRVSRGSGEGGIRTPDTVARVQHFQCCSFSRSDTSPEKGGKCIAPASSRLVVSEIDQAQRDHVCGSERTVILNTSTLAPAGRAMACKSWT